MMTNEFNFFALLQNILIWAIPILFAVTLHEVAHGWVAGKLGDKTATMLGRVTLNPFKHIDLVGTIIVPILFLVVGGFIFGWAKPVPVDWRNLKNPRRDMALVALAGPGANLLMALFWGLIGKMSVEFYKLGYEPFKILAVMGAAGISINLMLMIINLIPIPPLDGSRVVTSLLDREWAMQYEKIEPYGFMILVLLIFTGILSMILHPVYETVQSVFFRIFM
jgi:Zn-dependent protease